MAYTSHGHHILGTVKGWLNPFYIARCGGPGVCSNCSKQAAQLYKENNMADNLNAIPPTLLENPQKKAINLVFNYVKERLEKTDTHVTFAPDEVYVVWFSKTLQNWKALVSTTLPDGMYYEVTYNGHAGETYIDAYKKFDNVCVKDVS